MEIRKNCSFLMKLWENLKISGNLDLFLQNSGKSQGVLKSKLEDFSFTLFSLPVTIRSIKKGIIIPISYKYFSCSH